VEKNILPPMQRVMRGLGLASLALGIVFMLTGWHLDIPSVGNTVSNLIPRSQTGRGERLYNVYCSTCHGGPVAERAAARPSYPPPHNASGHTWQHATCELEAIVRDGGDDMTRALRAAQAPPGAVEMPSFKDRLSADEIDAILAYIKTMWTDEQRQSQERVTRASCAG
jgi:mono/diheme cytochrome c family protein